MNIKNEKWDPSDGPARGRKNDGLPTYSIEQSQANEQGVVPTDVAYRRAVPDERILPIFDGGIRLCSSTDHFGFDRDVHAVENIK